MLRSEVKGAGSQPAEQDVILTIAGPPAGQTPRQLDLPDDLLAIEGIGEK